MSFTVEHRRISRPSDKLRQGRATSPPRDQLGRIVLAFDARADGCIYCLLRRAEIGVICRQSDGLRPGFNWLCFLPEQRATPNYAASLDAAKDALRVCVEAWCEAAGLVARKRTHPHAFPGRVLGWRAGDAP